MLIYGLNNSCNNIAASYLKACGESMSENIFWTTVTGELPHVHYILRNPEPPGTEFNTVACSVTGSFLFVEIQRGKEITKKIKCHI